jgi:hypothetical protein
VVGVWNEVSSGISGSQLLLENGPVPGTRPDGNCLWLTADLRDEIQCYLQGRWLLKHFWMGDNPYKATEHQLRHAIRAATIDRVFDPVALGRVVGRIFAVGVDQDVDVHQDHCSMIFRSA